jgi:hypothetical protein
MFERDRDSIDSQTLQAYPKCPIHPRPKPPLNRCRILWNPPAAVGIAIICTIRSIARR